MTLGDLAIGDVTATRVSRLIASMRDAGYAESTIYTPVMLVLRSVFRLAIRRGLVARSPIDGLDPAEVPRPKRDGAGRILTEPELAAVVRRATPTYRAPVAVLVYSGLRMGEVLGPHWRDIDFVDAEMHVRGQLARKRKERSARIVPPKTSAGERVVPLWPIVLDVLAEHHALEQRAGRGGDDELLFVTRTGNPAQYRNVVRRGLEPAAIAAGLGHVTPHDLRRSFCSLAARRGVDPVAAAELTGHSLAVWATSYARSYGKPQRDEARAQLLEHGFGALDEPAEDIS